MKRTALITTLVSLCLFIQLAHSQEYNAMHKCSQSSIAKDCKNKLKDVRDAYNQGDKNLQSDIKRMQELDYSKCTAEQLLCKEFKCEMGILAPIQCPKLKVYLQCVYKDCGCTGTQLSKGDTSFVQGAIAGTRSRLDVGSFQKLISNIFPPELANPNEKKATTYVK